MDIPLNNTLLQLKMVIYYNILGFRILKDECLQNFDYFLDRIKINEKLKTIIFLRSEDIAIN